MIMPWAKARNTLGGVVRRHPDADVSHLRRQLRAARLAELIRRTLAQAPPLTSEERCELAAMLLLADSASETQAAA
jgi:hypothetical protein